MSSNSGHCWVVNIQVCLCGAFSFVARLVARHLSNPEISQRLFISRATVKTHLVHIFVKLGIRSRSELAAEAIQRGLG